MGVEQKSVPVHNSMHTFFSIVYYDNRERGSRIYANPMGCEVYNNFAYLRGLISPTYLQFMITQEPIAPEMGVYSNNAK